MSATILIAVINRYSNHINSTAAVEHAHLVPDTVPEV